MTPDTRKHVGKGNTLCWCGEIHFKRPPPPVMTSVRIDELTELTEHFGDRKTSIMRVQRGPYLHIEVEVPSVTPERATELLEQVANSIEFQIGKISDSVGQDLDVPVNKVRNAVTGS